MGRSAAAKAANQSRALGDPTPGPRIASAGAVKAISPVGVGDALECWLVLRSVRWLIPTLTVVVVVALGELHAHAADKPYPFTQEPRFTWLLVFIALIWVTTY